MLHKIRKRITVWLLLGCITLHAGFMCTTMRVWAAPDVSTPSYIVMEASTGQVICEQDADMRRSPASITKIMTLLIVFEHLKGGRIHLDDKVTTSAYAKSMGGSQVFFGGGRDADTGDNDQMYRCCIGK